MLIQQVTPDVIKWIVTQAQAGHGPDAVLAAMQRSGWKEDVARGVIEQLRRGSLAELPPPAPVPEPAADASWVVKTFDREVRVLAEMQLPRLIVFGNLLSGEECDALIELARPQLQRSHTVDSWSGKPELNEVRTSEGMYFSPGENEIIGRIERRIAELVNWPQDRGEGLQVLRYQPGAEYRPHHDYFDPTVPGTPRSLRSGGQRVASLVMYLNSPTRGGSTTFPDVGLQIAPTCGGAVFFSYDRPHPVTRTRHGGAPVIEGEKWIATKWLRAEAFTLENSVCNLKQPQIA